MSVASRSSRAIKAPLTSASPSTANPTPEQLLAALDGSIPRVRVNIGYQFGLLLVTCVLILLPLVYVALIGLVGYAVWWHVVNDVGILEHMPSGRGAIVVLFIYALPVIVGGLLVAFMVKPLFAKSAQRPVPFTLPRSEQQLLYAFVEKLCRIIGARPPARIDVDCQVNASASFANGLGGLLTGRLVLTIGLPLVSGMNLRQLTGVLAHEFGHFSQGTGMRLTYIARSINAWFARVVYQRDSWDEWLSTALQGETHWSIAIIVLLARLMVWITRRVLWVLMWIGHVVSSFMLRQMEFDADRYEVRIAGSDCFATTSERVLMLGVARSAAFNELTNAWREKRLCDDLSKLILTQDIEMPGEVRKAVRKHTTESKTGWFDSHPCDADRIRSAGRENTPGLFRTEAPAAVLFTDFEGLSRKATELFYRENLGNQFKPQHVVTTDSIVAQSTEREKAVESLNCFFQGLVHPLRPLFPDRGYEAPADLESAAELLMYVRTRLLKAAPDARVAAKNYLEADQQMQSVLRVQTMRTAGVNTKVNDLDLAVLRSDDARLRAILREAENTRAQSLETLNSTIKDAMVRINVVLAFHERERKKQTVTPDSGGGEYDLTAEAQAGSDDRVVDALVTLGAAATTVENVRREFHALGAALSLVQSGNNPQTLVEVVVRRSQTLHSRLMDAHKILRGAKYPYEHMEKGATLSRYCLELVPSADHIGELYRAAEMTLEGVYNLYIRLMSDLATRAQALEASVGLDPLPKPEPLAASEASKDS